MFSKNNKVKKGLRYAGNILFFALLFLFIFSPDAKSWVLQQLISVGFFKAEIKKDGVNEISPENALFSFTDSAGKAATTADLKGKVVFINFWASWCPPCRAEMPSLNKLYNKFQNDDRFVFLFINEDEDKAKAINYIEKNHFTIPLYARGEEVSTQIFTGTLPTTIIINKEGKVVLKHEGMADYNTDVFIKQLKSLF